MDARQQQQHYHQEVDIRAMQRREAERLVKIGNAAREARNNWTSRYAGILSPKRKMTWTPHLSTLLAGIRDEDCILSKLSGKEASVLAEIYGYAFGFIWENYRSMMIAQGYKRFVHNTIPANFLSDPQPANEALVEKLRSTCDDPVSLRRGPMYRVVADNRRSSPCAFSRCGTITFPPPADIDVNMLPFIMGDKTSLPDELQKYYDPLIAQCPLSHSELGKVCYLSITERYISKGDSQRRGGLHIEAPIHNCAFSPGNTFRATWGSMGCDAFQGGIFMASSVSKTCAIYDARIEQEATDSHGGMDYLRPLLNAPYYIPANELIWMTDRTPHQALPQPHAGYRQFFRLVTSGLNVWHEKNCTANPKVPVPDHVRVIRQSRFDEDYEYGDNDNIDDEKPAASAVKRARTG